MKWLVSNAGGFYRVQPPGNGGATVPLSPGRARGRWPPGSIRSCSLQRCLQAIAGR